MLSVVDPRERKIGGGAVARVGAESTDTAGETLLSTRLVPLLRAPEASTLPADWLRENTLANALAHVAVCAVDDTGGSESAKLAETLSGLSAGSTPSVDGEKTSADNVLPIVQFKP